LDLRAEPEREAASAGASQLPRRLRGDHRAAGERDGDRGADRDRLCDFRRYCAPEVRRPFRLGEPETGEPELLDRAGDGSDVLERQAGAIRVELHRYDVNTAWPMGLHPSGDVLR